MDALLLILRMPWLQSLAGVAALTMLIWYLGPLLSLAGNTPLASERGRIIATVIVIALWGLYQAIKWLLAKRKNKKLADQLSGAQEDIAGARSDSELKQIQESFAGAMTFLRKARLGKGRKLLYQLPWYMIIGPPGAGKTTALLNCGLNFPLQKKKIRGVGGTRNCDWWFTDEAVLIDTAGRWTTQDSDEAIDSQVWQGFLGLLKKYRKRQPINGVFIAISLRDLMLQDEAERTEVAQALKLRIKELREKLGINFPVYVLFTMADLVAGFTEFFDDLGKEGREQVWGETFALDDQSEQSDAAVERFAGAFEVLEQRLNDRLIERLQQEKISQNRSLIYTFPKQFSSLKEPAEAFLRQVFEPDPFEKRALLRGIYFTSATQQGNPIDRMLGAIAHTLGMENRSLPQFSGSGKSFFLTRLLKEVIFPEANLAGANRNTERYYQWLHWIGYAVVIVLSVALLGLWYNSYSDNRELIARADALQDTTADEARKVAAEQADLQTALTALDNAARLDDGYEQHDWAIRLGLYQGDKIQAGAANGYRNMLENGLLSRLVLYIENKLRQLSQPDELFEALTVYLMLDDPREFADEQSALAAAADNAAQIRRWFQLELERDNQLDAAQQQALLQHLQRLLTDLPRPLRPLTLNPELIEQTRRQLNQADLGEQLYQQLKTEYSQRPGVGLNTVFGNCSNSVFVRKSGEPFSTTIPYIYTVEAYQAIDQALQQQIGTLSDQLWVFGDVTPEQLEQLGQSIKAQYVKEYAHYWKTLLDDIDIACAGSMADVGAMLNDVSGMCSPLAGLLSAIAENTRLLPPSESRMFASNELVPPPPAPAAAGDDDEPASQRAPLATPETSPLDALLARLQDISQQIPIRSNSPDIGTLLTDLGQQLRRESRQQPYPLGLWLGGLADQLERYASTGMHTSLDEYWRGLAPACQQALTASHTDAVLFQNFFGPGGSLERFFNPDDPMQASAVRWCFDNCPGFVRQKLERLQGVTGITDPGDRRLQGFYCPRCL